MPETMKVGEAIAQLCREVKNLEAIDQWYADDVVSVEPVSMDPMPATIASKEAVKQKNEWWFENHDVNKPVVLGPFPHGDRFILHFTMKMTPKVGPRAGQTVEGQEVGLYTVKNGMIAHEEFFYTMPDE